MNIKDVATRLGKLGLPLLANAIAPGSGALVAGLASAIGQPKADTAEKVLALLEDSTEARSKAHAFEQANQVELLKLALQSQSLDNEDRDSARKREMGVKGYTNQVLAGLITLGFFVTILGLTFLDIPQTAHDPLMLLLGTLTASFMAVVSYYFGSTQGSSRKTELLLNKT